MIASDMGIRTTYWGELKSPSPIPMEIHAIPAQADGKDAFGKRNEITCTMDM